MEALNQASEAHQRARSAMTQLELAFEEVDDYGAGGAKNSIANARKLLSEASEMLENWEQFS